MDNEKNKKKEWFFSIAMLAVMIIGAGFSAWQAWEAKESRDAAQQSEQRIYELQVGLHTPRLETRRFTSFSTNLADPRDLERLMTNGISLLKVGTSWRDYDGVDNKLYGWLVILNNGEGPTKVVHVESFRYLIEN